MLLREQVGTVGVPARDKVRVVLDGGGLCLVHVSCAATTESLRRVGSVLYARVFAEELLHEVLQCNGKLGGALTRLQGRFLLGGNSLDTSCQSTM